MTDSSVKPLQEDEINLLEYLYVLVKGRWFIAGMIILGFISGYIAAKVKGPIWVADAVIAPKETEDAATPNLSSFGVFGGVVASQLSLGGNASLAKIDQLLAGRTFNGKFVEDKELAKVILPELWDTASNKWLDEENPPDPVSVGNYIKSRCLGKEIKSNTMHLSISHGDSAVSHIVLASYLEYLDSYIRNTTQNEAKENKVYLEGQLLNVSDPLLRVKIQELIAKEIEKMMVVSKEAFKVVDEIQVKMRFAQIRTYPVIASLLSAFVAVFLVIMLHAVRNFDRTEENKRELAKIKNELLRIPFRK